MFFACSLILADVFSELFCGKLRKGGKQRKPYLMLPHFSAFPHISAISQKIRPQLQSRSSYQNESKRLASDLSADEAHAAEVFVHSLDVVADVFFAVAAHREHLVFQRALLEELH